MMAQDSVVPPNVSDTSEAESLLVCGQIDLLHPESGDTVVSSEAFQWSVCRFFNGYTVSFGISREDSICYQQDVTHPTQGTVIFWNDEQCVDFTLSPSSAVRDLKPGVYTWWVHALKCVPRVWV
jgi:hypothetical protein